MNERDWKIGDRVRFVREYRLPLPPEAPSSPVIPAGSVGVVVRRLEQAIWVQVPGVSESVTLWFAGAFPDDFAKTELIEYIGQ